MRNKLIEDLKAFRTPICEGLNAKLPYAEELADYLLSSGVIKELTEENERLRGELETRPPKLVITKLPKGKKANGTQNAI